MKCCLQSCEAGIATFRNFSNIVFAYDVSVERSFPCFRLQDTPHEPQAQSTDQTDRINIFQSSLSLCKVPVRICRLPRASHQGNLHHFSFLAFRLLLAACRCCALRSKSCVGKKCAVTNRGIVSDLSSLSSGTFLEPERRFIPLLETRKKGLFCTRVMGRMQSSAAKARPSGREQMPRP